MYTSLYLTLPLSHLLRFTLSYLTTGTHMTMLVETIPLADLQSAVRHLVRSWNFSENNRHLPLDELAGFLESPPICPPCPVLSPDSDANKGYPETLDALIP